MTATSLLYVNRDALWRPDFFKYDVTVDSHISYGGDPVDTAGLRFVAISISWTGGYPTGSVVRLVGIAESVLTSLRLPPHSTLGAVASVDADGSVNLDSSVYNGAAYIVWKNVPRFIQAQVTAGALSSGGSSAATLYGTP